MFCQLVLLICVTLIKTENPNPETAILNSAANNLFLWDKSEIIHNGNIIFNGGDSQLNDNKPIGIDPELSINDDYSNAYEDENNKLIDKGIQEINGVINILRSDKSGHSLSVEVKPSFNVMCNLIDILC